MRVQFSIRSSSMGGVRASTSACLVGCIAIALAAPAFAGSCAGDLNDSGVVDGSDLALVLGGWGPCPGCVADITGDGIVDGNDLAIVLGGWGPCPSPIVQYSMQTLEQPGMALTDMGPSNTLVDFGLQIAADTSAPPQSTPITATRFAIWATSVPGVNPVSSDPKDQVTGGIGLGLTQSLNGVWNRVTGQFQMHVMLDGRYWLLDQYEPPEPTVCTEIDGSEGHGAIEPWIGVIHGFAIESVDPETGDETLVLQYELLLQPTSRVFPTFGSGGGVTVNTDSGVADKKQYPGLDQCEEARKSNKFVVTIQPHFIKYGPGAGDQTGASLAAMKANVEEIWGQCCIEFVWNDALIINEPDWADASENEWGTILNRADNQNTNKAIDVVFVKRMLTNDGKEHASGDGTSSMRDGKCIVADQAATCNPPAVGVLAHELGHAIGGLPHVAAAGTVMQPSAAVPPQCPAVRPTAVNALQCRQMRRSPHATDKDPKVPCCMTHQ